MERKFWIEGPVLLAAALGMLILPVNWLAAAVTAAAVHEMCHFLAAKAMKIPVYGIRILLGGCRMVTGPMSRGQERICAAAGPVGSLLLLFLLRIFPRLSICGMVQGCFNLLPIGNLDGGRILRCTLGEQVAEVISSGAVLVLLALCLAGWLCWSMGPLPVALLLFHAGKSRKLKNSLQTDRTRSTIELPIFKR